MAKNTIFDAKYKQLNAKQKEAVDTVYGPLMVVAGPGTGKTTVLTLRIANILRKTDAKPEEILALTFTENGARNMREKLREIIGDASFRVNIFTFHSFANHMRSIFPEAFGRAGDRIPMDEATKLQILENILEKQSFKELRVSTFGINLKKISSRISDLKRELISPAKLEKLIKDEEKELGAEDREKREKYFIRINEFATLFALYEYEKKKKGLYDFDDAITELVEALKSNPDMASEMRESYQFVLADEHQDANGAQNEILKMFKAKGLEAPNVFVVGDDKQSIFRFQGASLEHFYNFENEFKGAKRIVLTENYRSHKTILDASYSLITKSGVHQNLLSNVSYSEKKIEIVEYGKYETELYETAKAVKGILDNRGGREKIAIISRNNKALFDIAPFLDLHKVEYKISGERSLFEDFEYKRLLCLFEAISNPYDGALLKALYAGYFNQDIAEIIAKAMIAKKERRDFAALFLEDPANTQIKELIAKAKRMELTLFLKAIRHEIQGIGLDALRAVFDEARELTKKNRGAKLDDLIIHLKFIEANNLSPLKVEEENDGRVELFSIHRAKGLEFDYVYIIDATAKRFEKSAGRADQLAIPGIGTETELAEERRLLYVALTRAKKHVVISYSLIGDEGRDNAPSVLLGEINDDFVERSIYKGKDESPDLLGVPNKMPDKKIYRDAFLKSNFSVSAFNNFLECPWKYFFRNLLLVPEPAEFASSLGNACHEALRIFHTKAKRGKILGKRDLQNLAKQCVYNEPFTESELPLALEKVEKSILAYVATFRPFAKNEIVAVEDKQSFIYKVKNGGKDFEITLTGKIDLSRESNGKMEVIDFKTKKRMTKNEIMGKTKGSDGDEWRQLQFYRFLLERTKPNVEVSKGVLTFLTPEKGKILSESFALEESDKTEIERALREALLSIYNLDFWGVTCGEKGCEYCGLYRCLV